MPRSRPAVSRRAKRQVRALPATPRLAPCSVPPLAPRSALRQAVPRRVLPLVQSGLVLGGVTGAEAAGYSSASLQRRYDMSYVQCMAAKGESVPTTVTWASPYAYGYGYRYCRYPYYPYWRCDYPGYPYYYGPAFVGGAFFVFHGGRHHHHHDISGHSRGLAVGSADLAGDGILHLPALARH